MPEFQEDNSMAEAYHNMHNRRVHPSDGRPNWGREFEFSPLEPDPPSYDSQTGMNGMENRDQSDRSSSMHNDAPTLYREGHSTLRATGHHDNVRVSNGRHESCIFSNSLNLDLAIDVIRKLEEKALMQKSRDQGRDSPGPAEDVQKIEDKLIQETEELYPVPSELPRNVSGARSANDFLEMSPVSDVSDCGENVGSQVAGSQVNEVPHGITMGGRVQAGQQQNKKRNASTSESSGRAKSKKSRLSVSSTTSSSSSITSPSLLSNDESSISWSYDGSSSARTSISSEMPGPVKAEKKKRGRPRKYDYKVEEGEDENKIMKKETQRRSRGKKKETAKEQRSIVHKLYASLSVISLDQSSNLHDLLSRLLDSLKRLILLHPKCPMAKKMQEAKPPRQNQNLKVLPKEEQEEIRKCQLQEHQTTDRKKKKREGEMFFDEILPLVDELRLLLNAGNLSAEDSDVAKIVQEICADKPANEDPQNDEASCSKWKDDNL
ncbi:unnamed protein product, partial [Mesorhabditis belari]|uniref:Uncharacterized protein n=1 Tax=Mesorhabditis belari TaxID=2138241 RepID=A0AAF3F1D6_9BILA